MKDSLSSDRWEQVHRLFNEVVDLAPADRAVRLDEACRDDPALREEVESLLEAYEQADDLLLILDQIGIPSSESSTSSQPSYSGTRVAHYEVLEKLGGGGMGIVYKALDTRLKRIVALKFLPPQWSQDARAKQRFEHEAQAASALDHPNICTIYEIGEIHLPDEDSGEGQLFIAMAYYDGQTLKHLIKQGPLTLDHALDIATQIARGLAKAHTKDIVHRDVKPANVIITEDGVVKILDFGLAKMADVHMTKTGTTMGTVAYMSPEQTRGEGVDHRTDVWSLGVVLYEILAGERPFRGEYDQAVIYSLLNEEPLSLREVKPSLPEEVDHVVTMCLEKERDLRYPSVADLLADLEILTESMGAGTQQGMRTGRMLYAMRRRRSRIPRKVVVAGAGVLGVLLVILLVVSGVGTRSLPDQLHLAVLPFSMAEADLAQQALSDGLAETLRSRLTQVERFEQALWVVPADDMRKYRVTSPAEAQQWSGANLALSGHVERLDDLIRLTLTLVDPQGQRAFQSQTIEGRQDDISTFQEKVFATVADLLDLDLPPRLQRVLAAGGTTVPDAHVFYLRGRGYLEEIDKVDVALQSFELALEEDPAFALAYAGLGEAYLRKYNASQDEQWLKEAEMYSNLAIEQSDELAEVYVTLGQVHKATGDYGPARLWFREALERNPISAAAHRGLAEVYEKLGDLDEAEATYKKAIALKPEYWVGYNLLGIFYFNESRYTEAAAQFQWVIDLTPDNPMGYNNRGAVYQRLGHAQDAFRMYLQSVEVQPTELAHQNLGSIYYNEKKFVEAAQMFDQAIKLEALRYQNWGRLANAHHWAGQHENALAAWQRMIELAEAQRAINPRDKGVLGALAGAYAKLDGRDQEARTMLTGLLALKRLDRDDFSGMARTYEILGERNLALQFFEQALERGASPSSMERSPWMDDLRADPRYKKMTESYGELRE